MREIQYEIVKEIAVLSTGDSGYTKEINLISWNGKEPKTGNESQDITVSYGAFGYISHDECVHAYRI